MSTCTLLHLNSSAVLAQSALKTLGCADAQADYQFYLGAFFNSLLQFLHPQITQTHPLTFISPINIFCVRGIEQNLTCPLPLCV